MAGVIASEAWRSRFPIMSGMTQTVSSRAKRGDLENNRLLQSFTLLPNDETIKYHQSTF